MRRLLLALCGATLLACTSKPLQEGSASGGADGNGTAGGGDSGLHTPSGGRGGSLSTASGGAFTQAGGLSVSIDEPWLTAEGEWEELGVVHGCRVRKAIEPRRVFPGLPWTSCGAGCQVTRLARGSDDTLALELGIAPRNVGDDLLISTTMGFVGKKVLVLGTYLYGDGQPVLLLTSEGSGCAPHVAGRRSPMLFAWHAAPFTTYGWLSGGMNPTFRLLPEAVGVALNTSFDFDTGWGGVIDFGSVQLTRDPYLPKLHEVYTSTEWIRTPVGDSGRLFFTDGAAGHGKIVGLDTDDHAVTMASGDWYPANLGASSDRLVWLGVTGDRVIDGAFDTARIYSCSRQTRLGPCEVEAGPSLPITSGSERHLAVRGKWVGLTGCGGGCDAYIVDLLSSQVYRIRRPENVAEATVLGFSKDEVFLQTATPARRAMATPDGLLRIELASLAQNADLL